jgi:hypothetical protein
MPAQVDDLAHHLGLRRIGRCQGPPGAFTQALFAFFLVTPEPPVEALAADADIATGRRHVPRHLVYVLNDRQSSFDDSLLFLFGHRFLLLKNQDCHRCPSVLEAHP